MILPQQSAEGVDAGKWYMMAIEGKRPARRTSYCATQCTGHGTREEALAHYLQYQLDREADLWLDRRAPTSGCEICGEHTTLRARLGRNTPLYVLCTRHQSTSSLQLLAVKRSLVDSQRPVARAS